MSLFFEVNGTVKEVKGWAGEGGGGGVSGGKIVVTADGEDNLSELMLSLAQQIDVNKLTTGTKIWFDKLPSPGDTTSSGAIVGNSGFLTIEDVDWVDTSSARPVGIRFRATFEGAYYSQGGSTNMDVVYAATVYIPLNNFGTQYGTPRINYSMMPSSDGEYTVERISVNPATITPEEGERIILFYSDAPLVKPEASNDEEPVGPAPINPSPVNP